jgi:hypothetical protein
LRGTVDGITDYVLDDGNGYYGWKTILYLPENVGCGLEYTTTNWIQFYDSRTNWNDATRPTSRISNIFFEGYRWTHPTILNKLSYAVSMMGVVNYRIDHCHVQDLGNAAWIWSNGYPSTSCGVIDHCDFWNDYGTADWSTPPSQVVYGIAVMGTGWGSSGHYWVTNPLDVLGKYTPLSTYIEDCRIKHYRHDLTANDDAHYVVRHCIFDNCAGTFSLDAHGARGASGRNGTRAMEAYDNTFKHCVGYLSLAQLYAGANLFHNNRVSTDFEGNIDTGNDDSPIYNYSYQWDNRKIDPTTEEDLGAMVLIMSGSPSAQIFNNTELTDYTPYVYPHPLNIPEQVDQSTIRAKLVGDLTVKWGGD